MKILVVAGARPNFMKVAPLMKALRTVGHDAKLLHTGQHYDAQMSEAFFRDLELPTPHFHLGVGGGSHAQQTARLMEHFEPVMLSEAPDWLLVVGDVNSTLACALVAAKVRHHTGTRIAHVEAGLRSHDWTMPEEVNRVLTDRLSDLLLTPSHDAAPNLIKEGIEEDRIVFVGNVMIDTLYQQLPKARQIDFSRLHGIRDGKYALVTLHRPSTVDSPEILARVLAGLAAVSGEIPVVFPTHPRTYQNIQRFGLTDYAGQLNIIDPLGYTEMLAATNGASLVLTDSGGLQEETTVLGVPCVTLRESTERPATVDHGTNRLATWPLTSEGLVGDARSALARGRVTMGSHVPEGWDGHAAERIVAALARD